MDNFSFCQTGDSELFESPSKGLTTSHRRLGSYATYTPKKFQASLIKAATPSRKHIPTYNLRVEHPSIFTEAEQLKAENLGLKRENVELRSALIKLKEQLKEHRVKLHKKDKIVTRLSQLMNSRETEFKAVLDTEVAEATADHASQLSRLRTELKKIKAIHSKELTSLNQQIEMQHGIISDLHELVGSPQTPQGSLLARGCDLAEMVRQNLKQVRKLTKSLFQNEGFDHSTRLGDMSMQGLVDQLEMLREESVQLKTEAVMIATQNCGKECGLM